MAVGVLRGTLVGADFGEVARAQRRMPYRTS